MSNKTAETRERLIRIRAMLQKITETLDRRSAEKQIAKGDLSKFNADLKEISDNLRRSLFKRTYPPIDPPVLKESR
jgi:hypothetical protein